MKKYLFVSAILFFFSCSSSNESELSEREQEIYDEMIRGANCYSLVDSFNYVSTLINNINDIGVGKMSDWKKPDEVGYMSNTKYFDIGNKPGPNGIINNISIYVTSEYQTLIQRLKIIVNVNNQSESGTARKKLSEVLEKLNKSLNINYDTKKLTYSLNKGIEYNYSDSTVKLTVTPTIDRIEDWVVIINPTTKCE